MNTYDPKSIEPKWQKVWADTKLYAAKDLDASREKYYYLVEFPYPSGEGLHVGHVLSYTALDIMARHKRMQGYNVLYPMGWDAFGLPTENYAIKTKQSPQAVTKKNTDRFRSQLQSLGMSFDWDREVNTSDPEYYKWTQWIFLKLYEKGLAYQAELAINWCPFEKTGLANEEVVDGKHERCGTPVEKKLLKQWMLKITAYADRLAEDLKTVDYLDRIATQQVNWIGRSEGAEITWKLEGLEFKDSNPEVTVYTTRPDTLFGATFLVVSPELADTWIKSGWNADKANRDYIDAALKASELSRQEESKTKTGVDTGLKAFHPLTGDKIPVWAADYVLGSYGTGAIMAVPAHDDRDFEFAKAMNAQVREFGESLPDAKDVEGVVVIGYDPQTKQYLSIKHAETWLVGGGRNADETFKEAARRELAEETGYEVLELTQLGSPVNSYYYNDIKKSNRHSHGYIFLAIINSAKRGKAKPEAHEKFTPEWSDLKNLQEAIARTSGGVDHWLYALELAAQAVANRELGRSFDGPLAITSVLNPVIVRDDAKSLTQFKQHRKIVALVQNAEGEILTINWGPKLGGRLTIGGTIEGDESAQTTALREVEEETGYHDLEIIETGQETVHYKYYAFSKQEGHEADVQFVHLRLKSNAQKHQHLDESEQGKFKGEWVSQAQAEREITEPLHRYGYNKFVRGQVFSGYAPIANSGQFNGLQGTAAKHAIVKALVAKGAGKASTKYRLRDWIFSRQHYWGEPIPIIHCPEHGAVAVPADQLPVELPVVDHYETSGTGESPLAAIPEWVNTACPTCGGPAKRETDTMPNWAGSSWYFLRYTDPHSAAAFASAENLKYWTPVDLYNGGMEHTTLHLLYSRFWHKFLYDQGLVPTSEPYAARRSHGMILGPDGQKMSKSRGNVINPDSVVERYGADTIRLYEMFMGPFDEVKAWSEDHLNGVSRFLYRVWTWLADMRNESVVLSDSVGYQTDIGAFTIDVDRRMHKTLKKVHEDIAGMRFNTAVSALMELINFLTASHTKRLLYQQNALELKHRTMRMLVLMLAPFTPHLSEEVWHELGEEGSVHRAAWPAYDPAIIKDDVVTIIVQINGKLRANVMAPVDATQAELTELALAEPNTARHLEGKAIVKTIVVPRKLVNFVVSQ